MKTLNNLSESMKGYANYFIQSSLDGWWTLPLVLISVLLLSIVITSRLSPWLPQSREFQLKRIVLISINIVIAIFIAVCCFLWSNTNFYLHKPIYFIHWLSLLALLLTGLFFLLRLAQKYDRNTIKSLLHPSLTRGEWVRFHKSARSLYFQIKLWFLLPIIGFLFLLLALNKPNNLLAVLIDNSSSMADYIEKGKDALSNTLINLDPNTDIVISRFTERSPKTDWQQVQSSPSWQGLEGEHAFFENHEQASQYLQSIPSIQSTPLYEVLYSQFLFSEAQSVNANYARKILVLITDGEDSNISDSAKALGELLCTNPEFDVFWNEVGIMNLGGDLTKPFLDKALNNCQYYVEEDATELSSYAAGIETMTNTLKSDLYFPIWLGITYLIYLIACLLLPPKTY